MKYKIPLALIAFMVITNQTTVIVIAEPVDPNLNYYSNPPFEVIPFDIEDVVQNALQLNYTIKFSTSCLGISVGECIQKGWLNEWFVNENNSAEGKSLSVSTAILLNDSIGKFYNKTYIALQVSYNDFDFSAEPKDRLENLYIFTAGFQSTDPNMTLEQANEIIVNELKELGILENDINITFQGHYPTGFTGVGYNPQSSGAIIFVVIVAIFIILLLLFFWRSRK